MNSKSMEWNDICYSIQRMALREQANGNREAVASGCCRDLDRSQRQVLYQAGAMRGERAKVRAREVPVYVQGTLCPILTCSVVEALVGYRGSEMESVLLCHLEMLASSITLGLTAAEWSCLVLTHVEEMERAANIQFYRIQSPTVIRSEHDGGVFSYSRPLLMGYCLDNILQESRSGPCSSCMERQEDALCVLETERALCNFTDLSFFEREEWNSDGIRFTGAQWQVWCALVSMIMLSVIGSVFDNEDILMLCREQVEYGERYLVESEEEHIDVSVDIVDVEPPPSYEEAVSMRCE